MAVDPDQIKALVEQPVEALQVELKTWLDPRTNDGIAKLVKAIFAVRNRNGGFLLIGFDDTTRAPDPYAFDQPVEVLFHIDALQGLVSRYVSPSKSRSRSLIATAKLTPLSPFLTACRCRRS